MEDEEDNFLFDPADFVYARKVSGSGSRIEDVITSYLQAYPSSFIHVSRSCFHLVNLQLNIMNLNADIPQWFVRGERERQKTDNDKIIHLSSRNIEVMAKLFLTLLGYGVLITSVFLLFLADFSQGKKACIVAVFVLLFLVVMSMVTDVTPHESFMVLLGYDP